VSECALGAEISEDRTRCAVAKAWRDKPSRMAVKVVYYDHPAAALLVISALCAADEPVDVALDPRSQSATLCAQLAERGIVARRLGAEDVAVAHGEFMDAVANGTLRHFDQPELTAAVRGAQTRPLAGARALERRVMVDQSPLTAAEFAVWALARWEEVSQPGVYAV
jgi:hypothetical protein